MSVICSTVNASATSLLDVLNSYVLKCYRSRLGSSVVTTFTIASVVFLLPVYIFILHLGFKQWRRQGFSTMAMSHFDLFTYHMVLIELFNVSSCTSVCCGIHTNRDNLILMGDIVFFISGSGQLVFHTLTCAERYLAVVHPVTYMRLKEERQIRARSLIMALFWLLFILTIGTSLMDGRKNYSLLYGLTVLELLLILLFSLRVLSVLSCSGPGPGPGQGSGRRYCVDPSKLRAFYVIVSVLVVLVLRLTWNVTAGLFVFVPSQQSSVNCVFLLFTYWMGLPSSLIIPLLYLKRKEKLFRKTKNEPKPLKS